MSAHFFFLLLHVTFIFLSSFFHIVSVIPSGFILLLPITSSILLWFYKVAVLFLQNLVKSWNGGPVPGFWGFDHAEFTVDVLEPCVVIQD